MKPNVIANRITETVYISDMIRKLVTSTSALIVEEPADIDDLVAVSASLPLVQVNCLDQGKQKTEIIRTACFAWIIQPPSKVDPSFGKQYIASINSRAFRFKLSVLECLNVMDKMKALYADGINDNVADAMLLGSAIYSWVEKLFPMKGLDVIELGNFPMNIRRETRTQLPPGTYRGVLLVFHLKGEQVLGCKRCEVNLLVEAGKDSSSRVKKKRSKKDDDVTEELER